MSRRLSLLTPDQQQVFLEKSSGRYFSKFPDSFYQKPKVKSTILLIKPKENVFKIKNPKNLEHVTNVFFSQKRKMINKPLKILFKDINKISKKFNLDITKRPQNLNPSIYLNLCKEYEDLNQFF